MRGVVLNIERSDRWMFNDGMVETNEGNKDRAEDATPDANSRTK